jgi:hypothetical protein
MLASGVVKFKTLITFGCGGEASCVGEVPYYSENNILGGA